MNELEDASYFLESNKNSGYDNISNNVIRKCIKNFKIVVQSLSWKGCLSRAIKNNKVHADLGADYMEIFIPGWNFNSVYLVEKNYTFEKIENLED